MVSRIELIASVVHEAQRALKAGLGEPRVASWDGLGEDMRRSTIAGVELVIADPRITPEALHEAWCVERRAQGWVYAPVLDREARQHPCLVSYGELPIEQRLKDNLFRAVVTSLAKLP